MLRFCTLDILALTASTLNGMEFRIVLVTFLVFSCVCVCDYFVLLYMFRATFVPFVIGFKKS